MEEFNILFVDDESGFLDSIETIFGLEGIKVYCARSGEEALDAIKERSFNVIITDLSMEGINGIDLARRVREAHPCLPIILLTGNNVSKELAVLATNAGVSTIFVKPVDPNAVLGAVRSFTKG